MSPRTSTEHKRASQPIFEYWNNSARRGSEVSCALIENWFSRYPASEQYELRKRFRSCDASLAAAFHELCLHELLLRQGCTITVHPSVAGTAKQPDFKVAEPNGSTFLLEARTSTEVNSGPEYGPRYNRVLDYLRGETFDGFLIGVCELTAGQNELSVRRIKRHILKSLAEPSTDREGLVEIPSFEMDGWRIKLKAFPCTKYPNRTGLLFLGFSRTRTTSRHPLSSALKEKANRYGKALTLPLVISVSSLDPMLTDTDFDHQLLAKQVIWGSTGRRHLSAVLFTYNLWPETLLTGQVGSRLYLNPKAERPYSGVLDTLETFRLDGDSWHCRPGKSLWEILELPRYRSSLWG